MYMKDTPLCAFHSNRHQSVPFPSLPLSVTPCRLLLRARSSVSNSIQHPKFHHRYNSEAHQHTPVLPRL